MPRSPSPNKGEGKAGAGKHHQNNRLFDGDRDEAPAETRSPERKKTYGGKYDHFTFGDEEVAVPRKGGEKGRRDDERHWGAGVQDVSLSPISFHSRSLHHTRNLV